MILRLPPGYSWIAICVGKALCPTLLKLQVKNTLVDFKDFGSHNTQNKDLMMATARYLAEQEWPGAGFGTYNPSDPTGRLTLLNRADTYVHRGEREFNSPIYFVFHYGTFRTVAEFATETEMKNKAFFAAEWLLASAAGEWFQGHWAASAERVNNLAARYQRSYTSGAGKAIPWLYYGGAEPETFRREFAHTIPAALSNYRVPAILNNVANDRNKIYIHRESSDRPIEFYRYSYINPEWSLYSQHEEFDDDPNTPLGHFPNWLESQLVRWAVVWKSNSTNKDVFYMLHPSDFKKDDHGSSKREQVLQHKGTLVGVYNIPSGDPRPYLVGYVSNAYNAFIDKSSLGRIYLHYDEVMIAVYVTQGFNWNNGDEKFTENATKVGIVVETADPSEYAGSLANFRAAADAKFDNVSFTTNGNPKIVYTSIDGTTLESTYLGADKINGTTVNYDLNAWPLLDNPWMHQDYKGDILTVNHQGETRRYDFGNWTVDGDPSAIQAEAATVGGGSTIETTHSSYYGNGYVNFDTNGSFVEWRNVDGGPGGAAQLTFRYALQDGNRTGALLINGVSQDLTMTSTGAWTNYQTVTVTASLNAGTNNVIRLESTGQDFGNVDQLLVEAFGSVEVSTYLEAEDGIINAPMRVANDANASEGQYVWVPNGEGNGGEGYTELSFAVPVAGDYYIHGRVIAPTTRDNSFSVSLDGGADYTWSISGNPTSWVWNEINHYTLGAGTHTISVKQREDGTKLDQLWITSEPNGSPNTRTLTSPSKLSSSSISFSAKLPFRTYPNPADEQLTIEAAGQEDYQIIMYDLSGRRVLQRDQLSSQATLDVSGLRPGVYLIKLRNGEQPEVRQRVLIE